MDDDGMYNPGSVVEVDSDFEDLDKPDKPKKTGKCKKIGKAILKQMFSSVGLCFLLALYCVAGGFLLRAMEIPAALKRTNQTLRMSDEVNDQAEKIKEVLKLYKGQNETDAKEHFENVLKSYQAYIADAVQNLSYIGNVTGSHDPHEHDFGIFSCILFTVSIITLIGYGHIFPHTEGGQLMVIVYSLLGVPLTLMFLAKVGDFLITSIRWAWGKMTCYTKRNPTTVDEVTDEARPTETRDVSIPLYVTLLVLSLFVVFGTGIYMWLGNWSFIESIYWVIISITTIGFGDLVPGSENFESTRGQLVLAFTCFYLVVGLAMLSMVINLLIEGFRNTGIKFAAKLKARKARKRLAAETAADDGGGI